MWLLGLCLSSGEQVARLAKWGSPYFFAEDGYGMGQPPHVLFFFLGCGIVIVHFLSHSSQVKSVIES